MSEFSQATHSLLFHLMRFITIFRIFFDQLGLFNICIIQVLKILLFLIAIKPAKRLNDILIVYNMAAPATSQQASELLEDESLAEEVIFSLYLTHNSFSLSFFSISAGTV